MGAHGLRDMIKAISPPWKRDGTSEKLDYSFALVADVLLEKLFQAIAARMPTKTLAPDSLPVIGADRLIPQGLVETNAAYALRLRRAFDDWFYAGSARSVIAQILGFLSPTSPRVSIVSNTSAWDYVPAGSLPTTLPTHSPNVAGFAPTPNWNWDQAFYGAAISLSYWWRVWVIVDGSTWATSTRTWGAGGGWKWGDTNISWGFEQPPGVFTALRSMVQLWKSQHAQVPWIVVSLNSTNFVPTAGPGDTRLPDGNWRNWSKIVGNVRVPARFAAARYVDGVT